MEVRLTGRHADLDDGFREMAAEKLGRAAKVFDAVDSIDAELTESHNRRTDDRFRLEVNTMVHGRFVRIVSDAATAEAALDDAADRFSRQLKRMKERLIDGHRKGPGIASSGQAAESDYEVVRVKQFVMKPMTVDEASLQMDMLGHSFFFFLNAATDKQSVLYRRADGRLGMIEAA